MRRSTVIRQSIKKHTYSQSEKSFCPSLTGLGAREIYQFVCLFLLLSLCFHGWWDDTNTRKFSGICDSSDGFSHDYSFLHHTHTQTSINNAGTEYSWSSSTWRHAIRNNQLDHYLSLISRDPTGSNPFRKKKGVSPSQNRNLRGFCEFCQNVPVLFFSIQKPNDVKKKKLLMALEVRFCFWLQGRRIITSFGFWLSRGFSGSSMATS